MRYNLRIAEEGVCHLSRIEEPGDLPIVRQSLHFLRDWGLCLNATGVSAIILLIESTRRPSASVEPALGKKGFRVIRASSGKEAVGCAQRDRPSVIVFDTASWRGSCGRLCADLQVTAIPILVLLSSQDAQELALPDGIATLARPFTPRKFINMINRLLPEPNGDVLKLDDLQFNVQHRHVHRGARDYSLTPMQARLLEVFMRHPGETLSRHYLIKQVWDWNTDDLNDTRTLDVHVRWLRQIIEDDPCRPHYLTTVRGVGYRFGPPASGQGTEK